MSRALRPARSVVTCRTRLNIHPSLTLSFCPMQRVSKNATTRWARLSSSARVHASSTTSTQQQRTPREFPSSGFNVLDRLVEIEEETLPTYQSEKYYPVHIGDVFEDRYQVVGKLGYGVTSTVWLGRDLVYVKYSFFHYYIFSS